MTQTVVRGFTAWQHRQNAADLNRRSQAGWNLVKAGFFRYTFEKGTAAFRYDLDYCPTILGDDEWKRRNSLYAAQGWELVNVTATGWAYFRKPFDAGEPGEACLLPTPYTAAQEKLVGPISLFFWLRIVILAVGVVMAAIAVIRGKAMVLPATVYLILMLVLFFRMQAMQEKLKSKP